MIKKLSLENFRLFQQLELSFDFSSVIISGANGQGKTSVLEAIFYLANLRSFRTVKNTEMRKLGADSFRLSAVSGKWNTRLELEYGQTRKLKLDGIPVSKASDFTGKIRTIAFLPDDNAIIGGTSLLRRRFFDMFISMLDSQYFSALQQYSSAVKIRNFLLRSEKYDPEVLKSYHPVIAENGAVIVQKRAVYTKILTDAMRHIFERIRPEFHAFSVRMRYGKDTMQYETFLQKLEEKTEYDRQRGFTGIGPHLDDFDFVANDRNLRIYGSNGQKRITSFALKMAQFDLASANHTENTVVIVDDATGDLDYRTKNAFFEKIQTAGQQFFAFTDIENSPLFDRSQIITL